MALAALLNFNLAMAEDSEPAKAPADDSAKIVKAVENIVVTYCSGLKLSASETLLCIADGLDKVIAEMNRQRQLMRNESDETQGDADQKNWPTTTKI